MSNQSLGNRVQTELKQAVQSGLLPDSEHEKAEKLLMRLQTPVRLALLGMPASGKSKLMNLLVGKEVIPDRARLPTLQLVYGETEQSVCTLPDGTKKILDGVDTGEIAALSPVFVEMQMPQAALSKISILEVVAPNDPNAIHRASQWAAKRVDLVLWCTRGFTEPEQRIWSAMPDLIKDHAFCMITHADFLKSQGLYDAAVGAVSSAAGDDFKHVLAIATNDAVAARGADGSVDKAAMRESGGSALISAVLKEVDRGRQSAVDTADVLLHQHADILAQMQDATAEEPASDDGPATPDPEPTPETAATEPPPAEAEDAPEAEKPKPSDAKPAARDAISRLREIAVRKNVSRDPAADAPPAPEAAADPEPEAEKADIQDAVALRPATRDAYEHVITYLEERGAELATTLEEQGEGGPAEVMTLTVDHMQWLCDYLAEHGDDGDPALQRARDAAFDAADMVQLMQMEKRDSAALEAVMLMVQIKRELQADLAA